MELSSLWLSKHAFRAEIQHLLAVQLDTSNSRQLVNMLRTSCSAGKQPIVYNIDLIKAHTQSAMLNPSTDMLNPS